MAGLEGKVALVTGGRRGIGHAIASGLAANGARIAIVDVTEADNAAAVFANGVGIAGDISSEADVARIVADVIERCGRIDILVNNAAVFAELRPKPFTEIGLDEWQRVLDVNVTGMFLMCRAAVPEMRKVGGGRIVNISSGTFFSGAPLRLHYVTSKGAVVGLTRALARELGGDGICVNAIAPGYTVTEAQLEKGYQSDDPMATARVQERSIKREQFPEDLVGTAVFLAGPGADFITGQTFAVDGGAHFR